MEPVAKKTHWFKFQCGKRKKLKTELRSISAKNLTSNYEIIVDKITKFPGLRFYELKMETGFANGTLQHHVNSLIKSKKIDAHYDNAVPRYFLRNVDLESKIIIQRLSQNTTSKIIKLLLTKECQTFAQLVKYTKKSPGTVSLYKNKMVVDKIIIGTTEDCEYCKNSHMKIKYRLTNPEKVRSLVLEYGKSSLSKSSDNLADIFLSLT